MRRSICMAGVLLLACTGAALAQSSIDRSFKSMSKDCAGVQWSQESLAKYPNLARACQTVEEREGKTYVKFQATVDRNIDRGKQLVLKVKDGDPVTLNPPAGTTVFINGRKTPVSQLARGDSLTFYVPEDRFVAQVAQDETPTPQYVVLPIVYRETTTYEQPERTAAALPSTATNRDLTLILGLGTLMFAVMLTLQRVRGRGR